MRLRTTLSSSVPAAPAALHYNECVTRGNRRPILLFGGFAALFAAFVALLLHLLPGPRRAFDYMVAGTFATALALAVIFVFAMRRR